MVQNVTSFDAACGLLGLLRLIIHCRVFVAFHLSISVERV